MQQIEFRQERMRARWGIRTFGLIVVGGLITAVAAVAATVPIAGTKLHSNHRSRRLGPV